VGIRERVRLVALSVDIKWDKLLKWTEKWVQTSGDNRKVWVGGVS